MSYRKALLLKIDYSPLHVPLFTCHIFKEKIISIDFHMFSYITPILLIVFIHVELNFCLRNMYVFILYIRVHYTYYDPKTLGYYFTSIKFLINDLMMYVPGCSPTGFTIPSTQFLIARSTFFFFTTRNIFYYNLMLMIIS